MRAHQYEELRMLVDTCNEENARQSDLEGLLDSFAAKAIAHQRYVKALERSPGSVLPRSTLAREIRVRRMRQHDLCAAITARLDDELVALTELVRLIVQRLAVPALAMDVEDALDRRLSELDAFDRATLL